jgi:serine/threonine-protein kinase
MEELLSSGLERLRTNGAPDGVHARVGTILHNKWVLGQVIGAGGTAAVYEGTHRSNGRRVAVKVMHLHLSSTPDLVLRFQREGYIANKVAHPGAVAILDNDTTDDGAPYLVMDRLDGAPLSQLFERNKEGVDTGPALRIVHEILDILAAAHEKGIVHRDIKPDNVFLTATGRVMILDFGIARLREQMVADANPLTADMTARVQARTQDGFTLGTPLYMAPEQARGRWSEVDGRSDLWSVGAILFRLLTGKAVRSADNQADMILQAMTQPAPRMVDVAPEIDEEVAGIVDRALESEKTDRWPDAGSMQKAVRDAAERLSANKVRVAHAQPLEEEIPVPAMPELPELPIFAAPRQASALGGKLVAFAGLLIAGFLALAYTPRAAHGPVAAEAAQVIHAAASLQAAPELEREGTVLQKPAERPTSAAPTPAAAAASEPGTVSAITTVNVDDLPVAPSTAAAATPASAHHTHHHVGAMPANAPAAPAAAPAAPAAAPANASPAPETGDALLDRRR